jgi:5-formyltetrahydrofolate cyclo-ligase
MIRAHSDIPVTAAALTDSEADSSVIDPLADRRALRRHMRTRRRYLDPAIQRRAAYRLARHIALQSWYKQARTLALYVAADGEIDPAGILERAWADGKRVFLPQLRGGNRLGFREYRRGARLRRNRFGIPEPLQGRRLLPSGLDVVLLPLVAFDRRGHRLGMGGGFYDRTFAGLRRNGIRAPSLIGLAHGFQQVAELTEQPWDVPLRGVLTDDGWLAAVRPSGHSALRSAACPA